MPTNDRPTAIFLHIGKTAGASMRRALKHEFRPRDVLEVKAPSVEPGRLRRDGAVEWFASLPEEDRARPRLIMGHMTFGLHEHVPRPSAYLTLLRDPVALVRSQYRHVRRHEGHLLHERAKAYPDLAAYVESGLSLEMDNSQTRAFAGDTSTPFGDCDPSMLERAKANLQTFAVAGITERFDESIVAMIRAFGWRRLRYVAVNVDPSGGARAPLTARELEVVSQHNVFDLELYDWADARFRRDVIGSARFDDDLGAFRARNRRHAPIGKLVAAPRASIERLRSR